jgi:hypothetical protein
MKRGLIFSGLIFICFFLIISCEENATAPSIDEGNAGDTKDSETPAEVSDKVMYIFALDENLEQLSMKIFEDVGELELVLSEEILNEMKEERISIIEASTDVDEIRETIFAELPVSEYMSIQNIGSFYIEEGTDYEGCSWGCIKTCMGEEDYNACMVRCCGGKDTGLVPYQDW